MHTSSGKTCAVVVLGCQLLIACSALAQDGPSVFERCMGYANEFQELDRMYTLYRTSADKLASERADVTQRLAETNGALAQLVGRQWMLQLAALEGQMLASAQQSELLRMTPSVVSEPNSTEWHNRKVSALAASQQIAQTKVQIDVLFHQMKTTDQAGRLALERRKAVLEELQSIVTELRSLEQKGLELFNRYWELADVSAIKSEIELRAASRCLQAAATENIGAQFALAITMMRLKNSDEALSILNDLAQVPGVRGVALAARAELHGRMGKPDLSSRDIRQALSIAKKDVRVRMHCAMAHAAAGSMKSSELEWEAVLKLGTQEVAARRALAFIHASAPALTPHNRTQAMECAEIASKLAGAEDWAANIALALSAQANGEQDRAIAAAERATELAIGEKKIYCQAMLEQIKAGLRATWQF